MYARGNVRTVYRSAHLQKGIAQTKPSPAEKVPRNEADEEDKARYKLDTEAQIQRADF